MKKKLTSSRLTLAVTSMVAEQVAIWAVWRWLLPELGATLAVWVVVVVMAAWLIAGTFLYITGSRTLKIKEYAGLSSMISMAGQAVDRLAPEGMVKIKGELWKARAEESPIEPGDKIIVTGEDRLKLLVRKIG
jgi:membrane-bound serine protease (ClpP class)